MPGTEQQEKKTGIQKEPEALIYPVFVFEWGRKGLFQISDFTAEL